jgi:hypothetical protein
VQLPPIPEQPTRQDAVQALAFINALLDGFPFDGETKEKSTSVARSAALAAILTTAARGALTKAVPLFLVTASKPRTGKTYLINVIVLLATGHVPVSIAGAEKKEEFEKRVETAALTGRAILHLNNLPEGMVVESERLSELSTDGMVYIRKLGRHEEGLCDCRATTAFLNGNNVLVSSDLVPRTVHCRINAQRENPGTRKFTPPYPDQRVRANRGAYLAAVFTIIRAFRAAGSPKQQCNSVAGFEQWSRLVQQALIWLGMDDPLGAMEEMQTMDPQEEKLKQLMAALHECKFDDNKFTVAKCNDKINEPTGERGPFGQPIYKHTALRELMSSEGKINLRSFGQWLMQMRDKICDGWQIRVSGTKGPARIYHLVQVKAVATPEPATAAAPAQPVPAAASAQEEEAF